ncbi:ParB/RepB/Spo0J family partition protein [Hymenobacter baengnokdamensis]|uniref:ParB/RepB/Spo0J family partition protein n=1 Tax=Hymenobacter baengnokdamensis TaxID=2615203 RepID=UPI0012458180|nr:ParB/RepB/Spo0J family partition protein [Hymenobacter baengnokdamensis]
MSVEKNEEKIQAALSANPGVAGAAKRKIGGLGRGLNALIEGSYEHKGDREQRLVPHPVNSVGQIPVGQIEANPYQPRSHFDQEALAELADSIKIQGIIQPVTVRQLGTNSFQLISGERRLQASKLAGLETIPAYIRKADDQQMLEMALIENIQRENLNAIEIALSYQRLLSECQLRQEDLGERVGKNRSTVTNYLRLLKLPPSIQIGLRDSVIGMGHARALINIEDPQQQVDLFRRIVAEDLSVRRVEEIVRNGFGRPVGSPAAARTQPTPVVPVAELRRTERQLTDHFGSKVQLRPGAQGRGEIKISFDSVEDMQRILHILQPA